MRLLALVLLAAFATPGWAQVVRISSGEHPGFSRIVLELPAPADWTFGRTEDGYELRVEGQPRFDLSRAFDLIPRTRLVALWVDPESGALKLGIGCACHAMPFAFRPGMIVVDVRDGPPPPGSSFELSLDGAAPAALAGRSVRRPAPRPGEAAPVPRGPAAGYDWLGETGAAATLRPEMPPTLPLSLPDGAAVAMRDTILRQIGRGVAQGVVAPAGSLPPAPDHRAPNDPEPRARVRIGPSPGLLAGSDRMGRGDMLAAGDRCVTDERLAIFDWTTDAPIAMQFAAAQSGLFGEFDMPQEAEVEAAVRFYLGAGFGAEARQMIPLLPAGHPERAIWQSLALILDGRGDPEGAFAGMEQCDTAAAMWAMLSSPDPSQSGTPRAAAVRLAFSALPLHLRRHLGPPLVERFLARGDDATAQLIRDAIRRAPGPAGAGVEIMEAAIDVATGDSHGAVTRLEGVIAEGGTATPAALVGLVDARLAAGEAVEEATLSAIEAMLGEHAGGEGAAELQRAVILALASRGDFDKAMTLLAERPDIAPAVWDMLAAGPDSQLLAHAIQPPATLAAALSPKTGVTIAERLLGLGFADAALSWLETADSEAGETSLITARAQLKRRDGRAALAALDGQQGADAAALRAEALALVGAPEEMAAAWTAAGNPEAALRAATLAGNWARVAAPSEGPWAGAAALVAAPPAIDPAAGPLQQGRARVAESAEARARIDALLSAVTVPGR